MEPTGVAVSLTKAGDVRSSLREALSENATGLISAAIALYPSSTNRNGQARMC